MPPSGWINQLTVSSGWPEYMQHIPTPNPPSPIIGLITAFSVLIPPPEKLSYQRGAIKDPAHPRTSKGLSQAINSGPIRKFLPKYANIYVTIQSHGLSAGARTHYVTANRVRNSLALSLPGSTHVKYLYELSHGPLDDPV